MPAPRKRCAVLCGATLILLTLSPHTHTPTHRRRCHLQPQTDKLVGWYCYDHEGGNEFGQDRADAWAAAHGAGASGEVAETSPAADEEAVPHEPEAGGGGVDDPPRVSSESGESTAGADETLGGGEDEE